MSEQYSTPRFLCKSIMRTNEGWMVTFPDYESAGENPFAVREASRMMDTLQLNDWMERRILRIGGSLANSIRDQVVVPAPLEVPKFKESGAAIRTTEKMRKLKCGHLVKRRRGAYPLRCKDCQTHFDERVEIMRKRLK